MTEFFRMFCIWIVLLLIFGGGIGLMYILIGHVEKKNTVSGPVGRTIARANRENEQWIQSEGLPTFFGILGIGGLILVCYLLVTLIGAEATAKLIVYGGITLVCIVLLIMFLLPFFVLFKVISTAIEEKKAQEAYQISKPRVVNTRKVNTINTQEVQYETQTQNKYDDYSDDDWN